MTPTGHRSLAARIAILCALAAALLSAATPARSMTGIQPTPTLSDPVVADNVVVVQYGPQELTRIAAFDAGVGQPLWDRDFSPVTFSGEFVMREGVLYCNTTGDSGIHVISARDGTVRARLTEPHGAKAVACAPGRLCLSYWDRRAQNSCVVALDPKTLRPLWRRSFPERTIYSVRAEDAAFAVTFARLEFEHNAPSSGVVLAASDGRLIRQTASEAGAAQGIIEDPHGPKLSADQASRLRDAIWRIAVPPDRSSLWPQIVILESGDFLFVGSRDNGAGYGAVYAIQSDGGRVAWKTPASGIHGIAVADGRVFVTYGEPKRDYDEPIAPAQQKTKALMALDARTGRVLWNVKLGAKPAP